MDTNKKNPDLDSEAPEDDSDPSPLAIWLTKAREEKKLTILDLAGASGLSTASIYKIESGITRYLREATRKKLESALKMTIPAETAKEMAEESEIVGLGKLEDFDPHNSSERPKGPGIYVFYDISERPIYVGQGQNVSVRILEHEEKFWFKRPIVETASWIKIADAKLRQQIEQLMIRFLKRNAVINKQHVERTANRSAKGVQPQPREYRPAIEVAASILEEGPLSVPNLFTRVIASGARCKSKQSLNAMLRLKENRARFEFIGNETWRLRQRR